MTNGQDFFRKSLSKATFKRKLSSVLLPLEYHLNRTTALTYCKSCRCLERFSYLSSPKAKQEAQLSQTDTKALKANSNMTSKCIMVHHT